MDSLTQATLGAVIGEAVLGREVGNKGAILGAAIATIPDLDVLLTPFFTELEKISIHRGYSHSILFALLGAFVIAYVMSQVQWLGNIHKWKLWFLSFLALFTHILLDAFTNYGTQLFLPFNEHRVSFDSINIIDPFYTIPLLGGLLISLFRFQPTARYRPIPNLIGLVISSTYLIFTLANKQQIEHVFEHSLKQHHIAYNDLLTVPVGVGNMRWYGVAKTKEDLFIGQYSQLYPGRVEFEQFPINDHLLNSINHHLVDRMRWFSKGFYTVAEKDGVLRIYNMQCDMQGIRQYGDYKAPTAFYFEVDPTLPEGRQLSTGMHQQQNPSNE